MKFKIEKHAGVYIIVWKDGGRRPATEVEVSLMRKIQRLEKKLRKYE